MARTLMLQLIPVLNCVISFSSPALTGSDWIHSGVFGLLQLTSDNISSSFKFFFLIQKAKAKVSFFFCHFRATVWSNNNTIKN